MPRKAISIGLFAVCVGLSSGTLANESDGWEKAKESLAFVSGLPEGERCAKMWEIIWPWAKKRHPEALLSLFGMISELGLVFPGHSDDVYMRLRLSLTLLANATINDQRYKEKLIGIWPYSSGNRSLQYCLARKESASDCIAWAVERKLIPDFNDFVREVDAIALGEKASCSYPHRDQR